MKNEIIFYFIEDSFHCKFQMIWTSTLVHEPTGQHTNNKLSLVSKISYDKKFPIPMKFSPALPQHFYSHLIKQNLRILATTLNINRVKK